jgi:cation:H+ antiporter
MWLNLLFIIIGVILVLWGADRLTDGSVAIAEKLNIPQIAIGLTVVALGTSMPELCVSLTSALKGTADLAVGNVVGSNIFNSLLIVGAAAIVTPMTVLTSTVKKDIPFALFASILLMAMCYWGKDISLIEAIVLFILFLVYMVYTVRGAKGSHAEEPSVRKNYSGLKATLFILLGLACLIVGSNIFVNGAKEIAHLLGVSEAVIGLTIVAGGTSLPELATSVVSAYKGQSGIAIGNVLGSNVFNILMILGVTGIITPLEIHGISYVDYGVMALSMLLLWSFSYTKFKIERWEGFVLLAIFFAYMAWLITNAF